MLEEIKKEIDRLPLYVKSVPRPTVDYLDVIEILGKHNNQPDYKSAWEELKKVIWKLVDDEKRENKFWAKRELKNNIDDSMQELEQKYNLGGE